jgi:glycosyltransferase involved in cell wall biosynthesis
METRNRYFGRSLLAPISNAIFRRLTSDAEAIIAVSRAVALKLASRGVAENKIHVIPNGVAPELFDPARVHAGAIKDRYQLKDALVIGFVGGIVPWHGLDYLVQAALQIGETFRNVKFLVVGGEANSIADIQELAAAHGVLDRFVFTGWISHDEVPWHVAAMDIAVAPYTPIEGSSIYFSPLKVFDTWPRQACSFRSRWRVLPGQAEIMLVKPGIQPTSCALVGQSAIELAAGVAERRKV